MNKYISTNSDRKQINSSRGLICFAATALCAVLCGCGTARVASRHEVSTAPMAKPSVVYVADFKLKESHLKTDHGLLPVPALPDNPVANALPLPGVPKNPTAIRHKLVDSMSTALVSDLRKAGLDAQRLPAGEPMPKSGWLVRGTFVQASEGNQFGRAVIGFGVGKTDLEVLASIRDLAASEPQTIAELNTTANSGKAPGAGPTFVGAARLLIASSDLDRNVKQTASKIASEVVQHIKPTALASAAK